MTVLTLERKLKPLEEPAHNPLLKWLYLHLPPQTIKNRKMHHDYTKAISILMYESEMGSLDRESHEAVGEYLNAIFPCISEYEKKEFPIEPATPEEMLEFLMEQNNLSQHDLADDLGGQSVVSEILNGKRKLTRGHIERLSKRFHLNPATFYGNATL